jgi:hypothetical protein
MAEADSPWQLTDKERRRALAAVIAVASSFIGPFGPMIMWGFDYLYDRRDLIFNTSGVPIQAIAADSSLLQLSTLSLPSGPSDAALSINTTLDASARKLGIRKGDPVSLLVTGHSYVQAANGLVVPARIGEPVKIVVPPGQYSVTAFGSKQESLFTTPDPYRVADGNTTLLEGRHKLALSLASREAILAAPPQPFIAAAGLNLPLTSSSIPILPQGQCPFCGRDVVTDMPSHMLTCPSTSGPPAYGADSYRCDRCRASFSTRQDIDAHYTHEHRFGSRWRSR